MQGMEKDKPASLFGKVVSYIDVYYTENYKDYNKNFKDIDSICKILEQDTGQDFTNFYKERLGCFEYCNIPEWVEESTMNYSLRAHDINNNSSFQYIFKRNEKWIEALHISLVVYNSAGNVLIDELACIKENESEYAFKTIVEGFNPETTIKIYDCNGKLIVKESGPLFHKDYVTITYNMKYIHATYLDQDGKPHVSPYSYIGTLPDQIENIDGCFICKEENIDYEQEITNFFNNIVKLCDVVIIDPYMFKKTDTGIIPSFKYLTRLEHTSIKSITLLGSGKSDPDVIQHIKNNADFKIPFYNNLNCLKAKQNFHDRYIYIKYKDGENNNYVIYSVSNSFSNFINNFNNLLITKIPESLSNEVKNYLDGIIDSADTKYHTKRNIYD